MSRSITITNTPVKCYFCSEYGTEQKYKQFQSLMDKADKELTNPFDENIMWNGEFEKVDSTFYVCDTHIDKLRCDECKYILTRHQLANALNSDEYNHFHDEGPKHCNFGKPLPFACTNCWIKYDNELRAELDIRSEEEEDESSSDESTPGPKIVACITNTPTLVDIRELLSAIGEEQKKKFMEELEESPSSEPKKSLPQTTKQMWDKPLTLEDLETHADSIPKNRIQEENVKYGMAYCHNETKDKSIQKLREYLKSKAIPISKTQEQIDSMSYKELSNYILYDLNIKGEVSRAKNKEDLKNIIKRYSQTPSNPVEVPLESTLLKIQIDNDIQLSRPLPQGKTRNDFMKYILDFFVD
jgi:hypothetical protein